MKVLINTFVFLIHSFISFSQTIVQWNFNSVPADAFVSTGSNDPVIGTGTFGTTGATNQQDFITGTGGGTDNSALAINAFPTSKKNNQTAGVKITFSTIGVGGFRIDWQQRNSNTSSKYGVLLYSVDNGMNYIKAADLSFTTSWASYSYDFSGLPNISNLSTLLLKIVSVFGSSGDYEATNSSSSYNHLGTWNFDNFVISQTVAAPVELTEFKTKQNGKKITLNWKTASENNNAYFDVEHSTDGIVFKHIGQVQGKGTIATPSVYSFDHETPSVGVNYYRLKQVDFDGKFAHTKVHSAVSAHTSSVFYLRANSVTDKLDVITSGVNNIESYEIFDLMGRVAKRGSFNTDETTTIDVADIRSGIYFIRIGNTSLPFTKF